MKGLVQAPVAFRAQFFLAAQGLQILCHKPAQRHVALGSFAPRCTIDLLVDTQRDVFHRVPVSFQRLLPHAMHHNV
jgi:hypothetical protein